MMVYSKGCAEKKKQQQQQRITLRNTQDVSTEKSYITYHIMSHCYEPTLMTTLRWKTCKSRNLLLRIFVAGKFDSNQLSGSIMLSDKLALTMADALLHDWLFEMESISHRHIIIYHNHSRNPKSLAAIAARKLKVSSSEISPRARLGKECSQGHRDSNSEQQILRTQKFGIVETWKEGSQLVTQSLYPEFWKRLSRS